MIVTVLKTYIREFTIIHMQKQYELNRIMKLDASNHEFLNSLRCVTFNDALTKLVNYCKKHPDFKEAV